MCDIQGGLTLKVRSVQGQWFTIELSEGNEGEQSLFMASQWQMSCIGVNIELE